MCDCPSCNTWPKPELPGLLSDAQIRKRCRYTPLEEFIEQARADKVARTMFELGVAALEMAGIEKDERDTFENYVLKEAQNQFDAQRQPMIYPFEPDQVRVAEDGNKIISYGTSSYGYDVRCGREFKVFTNINSSIVDPKNFDPNSFVDVEGDYCIIPPNSFALARSVEFMRIPRDVLVVCLGKSTYARCGIVVNVTPLEPEWEGEVTLEFSNTTSLPAKIYANEGVAQMLFFKSSRDCEKSYKDRNGKYQSQTGVTLPRT